MSKLKLSKIILVVVLTITVILHFIKVPELLLKTVNIIFIIVMIFYGICKKHLTTWIILSLVMGIIFGTDYKDIALSLHPLSQGFIRLVKTIVAPIIISTLVYGIAGNSNLKKVGQMAWKSLLYFYAVTIIALIIGLFAINLTKAGKGIDTSKIPNIEVPKVPVNEQDQKELSHISSDKHWIFKTNTFVRDIFPENIIKSFNENKVLQVVFFAVIFGISLAQLPEDKKRPMLNWMESLAEIMFKYTKIIMYFAPIGVGAAIAFTVANMGIDILKYLMMLLLTLYGALIFFILAVLLPIALYLKIPIKKFILAIREPVSIAFATTSSDAALPIVMQNMERFGVPRSVVSFVIPTGYSFNLDGSTLYLSLASVFVAQACGMELSIGQQALMCLTLIITSKGVAAVPRATLLILLTTAEQFGLSTFIIAAIIGIDELMDMARTTTNVIGNCLASVVISKWEGNFDNEKALAFEED